MNRSRVIAGSVVVALLVALVAWFATSDVSDPKQQSRASGAPAAPKKAAPRRAPPMPELAADEGDTG